MQPLFSRQDAIIHNCDKLKELRVRTHVEAKFAWKNGATEEQMRNILQYIHNAQWRWVYVAE